jgi:hypothetical protein
MPHPAAASYLATVRKEWPRTPDQKIAHLDPAYQETLRAIEETLIKGQCDILADLVLSCNNKFAFAKQYMAFKNNKDIAGNVPNVPPEVSEVFRTVCLTHSEALRDQMARWFSVRWADEKEFTPTKPGEFVTAEEAMERCIKAAPNLGCSVVLLTLLFSICLSIAGWHLPQGRSLFEPRQDATGQE